METETQTQTQTETDVMRKLQTDRQPLSASPALTSGSQLTTVSEHVTLVLTSLASFAQEVAQKLSLVWTIQKLLDAQQSHLLCFRIHPLQH